MRSVRIAMLKHHRRVLGLVCLLAAGAGLTNWLIGCNANYLLSPSPPVPESTVSPTAGSPIDHIIVIMQENRTFDNMFNGFPGADSVRVGMSNGKQIPLRPVGLGDSRSLEHTHVKWWLDWNQGKMDGFEHNGGSPSTLPYSYVPEKDVEPYWMLARQYVLGDRMFQSNTGPSFVAHQYMIAGQSAEVAGNPGGSKWGCDAPPGTTAPLLGPDGTVLPGVYPCFDYQTVADLLDQKGVTWRYYAPASGDSFFILSAYDAVRHIRYGKDWNEKVITPSSRAIIDIQHDELAQVTWIVPDWAHSDHPGSGTEGPDWVASIVNAVGKSQYWNSTAIFVTWDDWGGWYDHVVPPTMDSMGPGFRVPLLIISPWAKHGYVTHRMHTAAGFIKFIENNFNLGTLGTRDAGADVFADCFDYSQQVPVFAPLRTKVTTDQLIHEDDTGPPDDD